MVEGPRSFASIGFDDSSKKLINAMGFIDDLRLIADDLINRGEPNNANAYLARIQSLTSGLSEQLPEGQPSEPRLLGIPFGSEDY